MSETEGQLPADERIHDSLREYGPRLIAGLVVLGVALVIALWTHGRFVLGLALLGPLAVGACIPLLSLGGLTDKINGWGSFFSSGEDRIRSRDTKFARYVQRPFYRGGSAIWRISEPVSGEHLKAGLRLAAFTYLLAIMGFALYVAIYVMLVIIAIFVILLIILFATSNDEEEKRTTTTTSYSQPRERDDDVVAPVKGAFYRGTNWFNEELAGRVDAKGNIYKGTNWLTEEKIGRVDAEGNIYKGAGWLTEEKVGRIDSDGCLYKGSNWFTEEQVGRVEEDGTVQKGTNWFNEEKVGRVDKSDDQE